MCSVTTLALKKTTGNVGHVHFDPLVACYNFEWLVQRHVQRLSLTVASTRDDGKVNVVLGGKQSKSSIRVLTEAVDNWQGLSLLYVWQHNLL